MFGWSNNANSTDAVTEGFTEEEMRSIEVNHTAHLSMFRSSLKLCEESCIDKDYSSEQTYVNRREGKCIDKCIGKFFKMVTRIKELGDEHVQSKNPQQ